jgi:hypothetical protein
LNLARVFSAGDDTEVSRAQNHARHLEICAVENVERLGAHLKSRILRKPKVALQREVGCEVTRSAQVGQRPRRIAKCVWRGLQEGRSIEILPDAIRRLLYASRGVVYAPSVSLTVPPSPLPGMPQPAAANKRTRLINRTDRVTISINPSN